MGALMECVVKENGNIIKNLIEGWNYFLHTEVVVGIPEDSNVTREHGVSNAGLLYLHEKGVPSRNIPARPVLKPAIRDAVTQQRIKKLLRDAAKEALVHGNKAKCEMNFHKAGMVGRDACKNWIQSNSHLAANKESTVLRKGFNHPLVETGSLVGSITYAVRKK